MVICLSKVKSNIGVISVFLSLSIISCFYELLIYGKYPILSTFKDRIISDATINGYDVDKRIDSIYLYLVFVVIVFGTIYCILDYIFSKKYNEQLIKLCEKISVLGLVGILCAYITNRIDDIIPYLSILVVLIIGTIIFEKFNISSYLVQWSIFITFSLTIFIKSVLSVEVNGYIVASMIYCICIIIVNLLKKALYNKISQEKIDTLLVDSTFFIFLSALIQSILLEVLNILNRRGILIYDEPSKMYTILIIIGILIGMFKIYNYKQYNNFNSTSKQLIENRWYVCFIIMIIVIMIQPNKQISPWNEYFETANHGLAIDRLFRYGQIPIVENFDAHMFYNQIPGIVYSVLNGYEPFAYALYDLFMLIPIYVVGYFTLVKIYGKLNALILIVGFPFISIIFPKLSLISIVLLVLFRMIEKESKWNNILFWLTISICTLLSLDMGVASLGAGIITYILISIREKNRTIKEHIHFVLIGIITFVCGVLAFSILCIIKNISPIDRIKEFIKLCLSNQNWAYSSVGDPTLLAFGMAYYIIPLCMVALLGYTIYKEIILRESEEINKHAFIGFLFFGFAYLMNISRGIVRHSLVENTLDLILAFFPLAILCYIVIWNNRKSKAIYKLTFSAMGVSILMNINNTQMPQYSSNMMGLIGSVQNRTEYVYFPDLSTGRVDGDKLNNEDVRIFKEILDELLLQDETYLDITSNNYYYALVERKNPVYINQSPLLLNGESSQKRFIKQIKQSAVPLAILPIHEVQWSYIDGVNILDKYYLVAEFIYQNYEPLCRLQGVDIWVQKERKQEMSIKLEQLINEEIIYTKSASQLSNQELGYNNIMVTSYTDKLVVSAIGEDPFIEKIIIDNNNSFKEGKYTINIKLKAEQSGKVQVFYKMSNQDKYSEEHSKVFEVLGKIEECISIELDRVPYEIRIDIDNIENIEIYELEVKEFMNNARVISYQEAIEGLAQGHNLGLVPWIWANYDDNNEIRAIKEVVTDNSDVYFNVNIEDNDVNYINLKIDSNVDQNVVVEFVNSGGVVKPMHYKIRVKPGLNNYRIRCSSNYGIYLNIYDKMHAIGEQDKIELLSIVLENETIN